MAILSAIERGGGGYIFLPHYIYISTAYQLASVENAVSMYCTSSLKDMPGNVKRSKSVKPLLFIPWIRLLTVSGARSIFQELACLLLSSLKKLKTCFVNWKKPDKNKILSVLKSWVSLKVQITEIIDQRQELDVYGKSLQTLAEGEYGTRTLFCVLYSVLYNIECNILQLFSICNLCSVSKGTSYSVIS
jgi:hypothetical protein